MARRYQYGYQVADPLPVSRLVADFRSDTVTRPTKEMMHCMTTAEDYGDDVYGEDQLVIQLENKLATLANKEAGLFCVSGTMANQLGLRAQLNALESLICDERAHIFQYEAGGVAYHCQAQVHPIAVTPGNKTISPQQIYAAIALPDVHKAVTAGVSLENTILGSVVPLEEIKAIKEICKENGLFLHLDGARIANACVKENLSLAEYLEPFDSVSICLSKSLGCPIGSVLLGTKKMIQRAKHFRKLFGGGWRQAGILAAAGIYALDHHWNRLAEDHENASYLTKQMEELGFTFTRPTETNQIWADSKNLAITFDTFAKECRTEGIIIPSGDYNSRLVLHLQTTRQHCDQLIEIFKRVIQQNK